jgi:RNA polymerase sigma factor (sigma-70 family)
MTISPANSPATEPAPERAIEPDTDSQLLGEFVHAHSPHAFEQLVRRHGPMVLGLCRRMLRHPSDVEDAFQSVFLILARRASSIGRRELLVNWLYGVAYRVASRARTVRCRRQQRETSMESPAMFITHTLDPLAQAASNEAAQRVDQELNRLPARYRQAIILCYFQGLTKDQAALAMHAPAGTISTWLARARQMLASALAPANSGISAALISQILTEKVTPPPELANAAINIGVAGAASAPAGVALLAKGTVNAMWISKIKLAAVLLLSLLTLGGTVAAVIDATANGVPDVVALAPTSPAVDAPVAGLPGEYPAADGWVWRVPPMGGGASLWATRGMVAFMDDDQGSLVVSFAYQEGGELRAVAFDKKGNRHEMKPGGSGSSDGVALARYRLEAAALPRAAVDRVGIEQITPRGKTLRRERALAQVKELGIEVLPRPVVGEVYSFSLKDTAGKPIRSQDFKGKVVLVDCWATWCGPCVAQLPDLKKLHQKHHEQGLEIVGVSMDFQLDKMKGMVEAMSLPWSQVLVPEDRQIRTIWQEVNGITSIPRILVIDRQGILRGDDWHGEELERQVAKLLAEK